MAKIDGVEIPTLLFDEQGSDPSTPGSGLWRAYFKSDGLYIIDDAAAVTGPLGTGGGSTWGTWSPTVANFTVGTGGNAGVTAEYTTIGKTVVCSIAAVLGTSGQSVGGSITITLPSTAVALPTGVTRMAAGNVLFGEAGVAVFEGSVQRTSTTQVTIFAWNVPSVSVASNAVTSTVPFTWDANDWFTASWIYQEA